MSATTRETIPGQDPLGLRDLPQLQPPTDLWPRIEAGLNERVRPMRAGWAGIAGIAAALLIVLLLWHTPGNEPTMTAPAGPDHLGRLVSLSQKLESQLLSYREDAGPMSSDQAIMLAELEDLIAFIDQQLLEKPDSTDLWYQRVSLMSDVLDLYAIQRSNEVGVIASL